MDKEEIKTAIFEALGEVSMCWIPKPSSQIFDSTKAKEIGDRLVDQLLSGKEEEEKGLPYCKCGKDEICGICFESKGWTIFEGRLIYSAPIVGSKEEGKTN